MPIAPTPTAVTYTPEQAQQRINNAALRKLTALQWTLFSAIVTSRKAAADTVYAGDLAARQSLNDVLGAYAPSLGIADILQRVLLAVTILEPQSQNVADVVAELQKPFAMPKQQSDGSWTWPDGTSPAGTLVPSDLAYSIPGVDLAAVVGGIIAAIAPMLDAESVSISEKALP